MLGAKLRAATSTPMPVLISSSTSRTTTAGNTVTAPASIQDNDYLVAVCVSTANNTITAPAGFTLQVSNSGAGMALSVYAKVASSESGNYAFTWSGAANNTISIMVYRSCDNVNASGVPAKASSATIPAASISPTVVGVLCAVFAQASTNTVVTPPAGMSQIIAYNAASPCLYIYELTPSATGATGIKTLVLSGSAQYAAVLFQLAS